jgi:hypothetical protein
MARNPEQLYIPTLRTARIALAIGSAVTLVEAAPVGQPSTVVDSAEAESRVPMATIPHASSLVHGLLRFKVSRSHNSRKPHLVVTGHEFTPPTVGQLAMLRSCESSGNYATDTGNGYYGAYQFDQSTWTGLGFDGAPYQASPETQDDAVRVLETERGWQPWPSCSASRGLIAVRQ